MLDAGYYKAFGRGKERERWKEENPAKTSPALFKLNA
jgi:hypothetical protein